MEREEKMNRYIDADELISWIASHDHDLKDESNCVDRGMYTIEIIRAIETLLTTDSAEPIKHGHWVESKGGDYIGYPTYECSECGCPVGEDTSNYCPYCGAKMN